MSTEPTLQPLSGETMTCATANTDDGARLDISAAGFWGGHHQKAYFDVKVFNPIPPAIKGRKRLCYITDLRERNEGTSQITIPIIPVFLICLLVYNGHH